MTVFAAPLVTSRDRKALIGTGVGDGVGQDAELAVPHSARAAGACTKKKVAEAAAASITTAGPRRGNPNKRMKRGNGTRAGLVTPAARESTRPRLARGSASSGRAPRATRASGCGPRAG